MAIHDGRHGWYAWHGGKWFISVCQTEGRAGEFLWCLRLEAVRVEINYYCLGFHTLSFMFLIWGILSLQAFAQAANLAHISPEFRFEHRKPTGLAIAGHLDSCFLFDPVLPGRLTECQNSALLQLQ